jgi:hypothetical protein
VARARDRTPPHPHIEAGGLRLLLRTWLAGIVLPQWQFSIKNACIEWDVRNVTADG